jgi:uncharacterized protein YkwD
MSGKIPGGCLLGSLVLTSAAYAQVGRDRTSESTARSPLTPAAAAKAPDLPRVEQLIVAATNRFRRQNGRGDLRPNPQLTAAAREFAQYMARTGHFSHTADGQQPWDRTAVHGYEECIVAENIAWEFNPAGFTTRGLADAFVEGWKKSPEHRKNLLDPDVTEIGVGVAYSDQTGRSYAVQDFGRPKAEEIVFTVADEADAAVTYTVDGKDYTIQPRYTVTHRRCRPPQLTFRLPDGAAKGQVFRPHSGSRYVIRSDSAGRYSVEEE